MEHEVYQAFTNPRSVAIIGASDDPNRTAGKVQKYLRRYGYEGAVYPVNSRRTSVQGEPAISSVKELDAPPDLAVVVLPAAHAVSAVRDCAEVGVPAVIVISSGFAEVGPDGQKLQDALMAAISGTPTRVLGPNCLGVVNARSNLTATVSTGLEQQQYDLTDGGIAFLSQSGAIAAFVFTMAQSAGIGFGPVVSTGNEMDVSYPEMLNALLDDDQVDGVVGYIEGIRDGDDFLVALRRAHALKKPLAFLKVGRSTRGVEAIASHTGALAGSEAVYSAVFDQFGVTRVDGIDALADWIQIATAKRSTRKGRVCVASTSGGGGVMVADYCSELGIELAELAEDSLAELRAVLPSYASVGNPIDMTGAGGYPGVLRGVLSVMDRDEGTDVMVVFLGNLEAREEALVADLVDAHRESQKLLVVVWVGGSGAPIDHLIKAGIPAFTDPGRAMAAIAAMTRTESAWSRPLADVAPVPEVKRQSEAHDLLRAANQSDAGLVSEFDARRLLSHYGIDVVRELVVDSADAVGLALESVGTPAAIKLSARDVIHKSDLGGVALGIDSPEEARRAAADIEARLPDDLRRCAKFLVQKMVPAGLELLVAIRADPVFGHVLVVGLGGTWTEILNDVQMRVLPLTDEDRIAMIRSLRGSRLFDGFRGDAPSDIDAVAAVLAHLENLAVDLGDRLVELEINPLIIGAEGEGATVVDTVLRVTPGGDDR